MSLWPVTGLQVFLIVWFLSGVPLALDARATENELIDSMIAYLERGAQWLGSESLGDILAEETELLNSDVATSIILDVTPGRSYEIIVSFEEGCPPVEITILNSRGESVIQGTYRSIVSITGTPDSGHTYILVLKVSQGASEPCRAGVLLLDKTGQSSEGFVTYDNYDLFGGDIGTVPNTDLATCIADCESRAECIGYTFDKWNSWCFLKSEVSELSLNPRAQSGVRESVSARRKSTAPLVMERYENRAFPYGGEEAFTSPSTEQCERRCFQQEACVAFTYFKDTKLCRLMEHTFEYEPDRSADSGLKWQRNVPKR